MKQEIRAQMRVAIEDDSLNSLSLETSMCLNAMDQGIKGRKGKELEVFTKRNKSQRREMVSQ